MESGNIESSKDAAARTPNRAPSDYWNKWGDSFSGTIFGRPVSYEPDSQELIRIKERWARSVSPPSLRMILWAAFIAAFLVWALHGVEANIAKLILEIGDALPVLNQLVQPDWSVLAAAAEQTVVTVQMAVIGILGATIISIPYGLMAARNVSGAWLYAFMRVYLSFIRSIPDLVWAILFVVIVGLGPWAGTLAIIVGTSGSFGKLFAEAIESVDPRPVEAVRSTGATTLQVGTIAMLPQAMPVILSYVLFYWESTVRNAAIFGLVGAGGIGQLIDLHLGLLRYDRLAVDVLCILVAVVVIDRISALIRARFL